MKLLYKYTFGRAPVDNLITNTIINGNLVILQQSQKHLLDFLYNEIGFHSFYTFGAIQYVIGIITYKTFKQITYEPEFIKTKLQKYELPSLKTMSGFYFSSYMIINSFRGSIYWNQHNDFIFTHYDHTALLPIFFGTLSYLLIRTNKNKLAIKLSKESNPLRLVNICFMLSLTTVGIPMNILIMIMSGMSIQLLKQLRPIIYSKYILYRAQINP
ncbi:hypothetical protein pb186bvf_020421 [Paramecium bursaria]